MWPNSNRNPSDLEIKRNSSEEKVNFSHQSQSSFQSLLPSPSLPQPQVAKIEENAKKDSKPTVLPIEKNEIAIDIELPAIQPPMEHENLLQTDYNTQSQSKRKPADVNLNEEKTFYSIQSQLNLIQKKYESLVWDSEKKIDNAFIGEQSLIQKILLYQLAFENILTSYLIDSLNYEEISMIIKNVDTNTTQCLKACQKKISDLISRVDSNKAIDRILERTGIITSFAPLQNQSIKISWFMPELVVFLNAGSVKIKEDHGIRFPFLVCKNDHSKAIDLTNPGLQKGEKYLVAIINCEILKSTLLEIYIKNVALTLNSAVRNETKIVGASLVFTGRVSSKLLTWFRGTSPIDPSPIPHVEVIYCMPLLPDANGNFCTLSQNYLFTLKKGTSYRLSKKNNRLMIPAAKEIYGIWQKLRPFTVIDHVINEAAFNSNDSPSFVNSFWKEFKDTERPVRDFPNLEQIHEMKEELSKVVSSKIDMYKQMLQKDVDKEKGVQKNQTQNGKLLELLKGKTNLNSEVCEKVKTINKNPPLENVFYLDWNHIIYDAIKNKNYCYESDDITSITPEVLSNKNVVYPFYRNKYILNLDDLAKSFNGQIRVHFKEKPSRLGNFDDYPNRVFNWTLMTIIAIYMQLNLAKIKDAMENFINAVFERLSKSDYNFLYKFIDYYKRAVENCKNPSQKFKGKQHEICLEFYEIFANVELLQSGSFLAPNCTYFIEILKLKLWNLKETRKEQKKQFLEVENKIEFLGNLFENNSEQSESNSYEYSQISTDDNAIHYPEAHSEAQLVELFESKPLFGDVSLKDIYILLDKYKDVFEAVEFYPKDNGYAKLEQLNTLVTFWNNNKVWRYFYFFKSYIRSYNIVKYIYVINRDDNIKVAHEPICGSMIDRPCHSQLAGGFGVKAAGELIFQYINDCWNLIVINNGSGHYRPPAHLCLPYAKDKILSKLKNTGICCTSVVLLNSLKPGMTLTSGWNIEDVPEVTTGISVKEKIDKKDIQESNKQLGWNCFDIAVGGIDRRQLIEFALTYADDIKFRQLLTPEIMNAAMLTTVYMNRQQEDNEKRAKEIMGLFLLHDVLPDDSVNKVIIEKHLNHLLDLKFDEMEHFILPLSMRTEELQNLVNNYTENNNQASWDALYQFCESEEIYREYITQYYGQQGWFAFQPGKNGTSMVDIVARFLNKQIIISQNGNITYRTTNNAQDNVKIIYNGYNHFYADKTSNLSEIETLPLEQKNNSVEQKQISTLSSRP